VLGVGDSGLKSQLLRRQRSEVSWFEVSLGKCVRPYLEKPFTKKGWWSGLRFRP
jgi:hypothetical protein